MATGRTSRPWRRSGRAGERCWKYDWVIDLRCPEVLRHRAVGPRRPGGRGGHRLPLGAVVCEAVARCRRCSTRTARLSSGTRELRKGRRFRRSWRTCSCTYAFDSWMARKYPGLPVRALRRRCRRALHEQGGRPSMVLGRDRRADGRGGASASPRQDEDRLLQGQQPSGRARAHLVHLSRVRLPATGGASQGRRVLHRRSRRRSVPRRSRPKAPISASCGSTGAPTCR